MAPQPPFPPRGQKSPNFWDDDLQRYIDYGDSFEVVSGIEVTLDDSASEGSTAGYVVKTTTTFTSAQAGSSDLEPGVYTLLRTEDGWAVYAAGQGRTLGAPPDNTPPTDITDLAATGGESELTITGTNPTDAESTARIKYRVWLTSGGATGAYLTANAFPITVTGLAAGAYTVQAYSFSNGGQQTTPDSATATVTEPPGWNAYDSLTSALIGADGSRGNPADFTTTGARTWRTSNRAVSVTTGRITTTTPDNQPAIGDFVSGAPTGEVAIEFDYADLNWTGDYGASSQINFPQTTPSAWVRISKSDPGGTTALDFWSDYSGPQIVFSSPSGHGYTWNNGGTVTGIPASARFRVERLGQVINAYVNDVLVLSGDYSACTYSGSPNPLTTGAPSFRLTNHIKVTNIEWETYA